MQVRPGGISALDVFVEDLISCHAEARAQPSRLAALFREDSLAAILLRGGNEESWVFAQLQTPGAGREVFSVVLRRLYSAIFDSGLACTQRQTAPLGSLLARVAGLAALAAASRYGVRSTTRRAKL